MKSLIITLMYYFNFALFFSCSAMQIPDLVRAQGYDRQQNQQQGQQEDQQQGQQECSICLDELHNQADVVLLQCRHQFHRACLNEWRESGHNTCPYCRAEIIVQVARVPVQAAQNVGQQRVPEDLLHRVGYYAPTVLSYTGASILGEVSRVTISAMLSYLINEGVKTAAIQNGWVHQQGWFNRDQQVEARVPYSALFLLGRITHFALQPALKYGIDRSRDSFFSRWFVRHRGRELDENDRTIMTTMDKVFGIAGLLVLLQARQWSALLGSYLVL